MQRNFPTPLDFFRSTYEGLHIALDRLGKATTATELEAAAREFECLMGKYQQFPERVKPEDPRIDNLRKPYFGNIMGAWE